MKKRALLIILEKIAKTHLDIDTLDPKKLGVMDEKYCQLWGVKAALEAAFKAGIAEERMRAAKLRALEYYRDVEPYE